jgi:hypothetical protein
MARKKKSPAIREFIKEKVMDTFPEVQGAIDALPFGLCRKCRFFDANNKLKGYWEGLCGQGKGMVKDTFSCELWEAKNG